MCPRLAENIINLVELLKTRLRLLEKVNALSMSVTTGTNIDVSSD